ncbi:MAG TPA: hypothetical protein VII73_07990 [Caulobacteraceae bacterium]
MANTRGFFAQDLIWRLEAAGIDVLSLVLRALPVDLVSDLGATLFRRIGPLTSAHHRRWPADAYAELAAQGY